jgi:hypothetical protein
MVPNDESGVREGSLTRHDTWPSTGSARVRRTEAGDDCGTATARSGAAGPKPLSLQRPRGERDSERTMGVGCCETLLQTGKRPEPRARHTRLRRRLPEVDEHVRATWRRMIDRARVAAPNGQKATTNARTRRPRRWARAGDDPRGTCTRREPDRKARELDPARDLPGKTRPWTPPSVSTSSSRHARNRRGRSTSTATRRSDETREPRPVTPPSQPPRRSGSPARAGWNDEHPSR